jgi:hypothetical protein
MNARLLQRLVKQKTTESAGCASYGKEHDNIKHISKEKQPKPAWTACPHTERPLEKMREKIVHNIPLFVVYSKTTNRPHREETRFVSTATTSQSNTLQWP